MTAVQKIECEVEKLGDEEQAELLRFITQKLQSRKVEQFETTEQLSDLERLMKTRALSSGLVEKMGAEAYLNMVRGRD